MEWDINGLVMHMNKRRFSIDSILLVIFVGLVLFFGYRFYLASSIETLRTLCLLFLILMVFMFFILYMVFRKLFLKYSEVVCNHVDALAMGKIPEQSTDEDTLTSKIQTKLDKLSDITYSNLSQQAQQKQEIQQIVSDISHQLKTPIANITLYSSMLEEEELSKEQTAQFLGIIHGQVKKLEFLIDSLMKMSRLENHFISLVIQPYRIFDTIVQAVSQVSTSAQKKEIQLEIQCDETILLPHDPKWTTEALFNIIDNAVKYTNPGGHIWIRVEPWEIFTRIEIQDTGIGIKTEHFNDIFQRFYREGKVHNIEGAGIGLYLSRQIISQQGGYIKVKSQENVGSIFSVFLPNEP